MSYHTITYSQTRISRILGDLHADPFPIHSLNRKLIQVDPILAISSTLLLIVRIRIYSVPKSVPLCRLDVTHCEGIVEGLGEDDHYKIFAGVVILEVETLQIAVPPLEIVTNSLRTFLQEPELVLSTE